MPTLRTFPPLCRRRGETSLVEWTCLTPRCLWRGSGEVRDLKRWGKREIIPNTALSPPDFCVTMGSDESHFNKTIKVTKDAQSLMTFVCNQVMWGTKTWTLNQRLIIVHNYDVRRQHSSTWWSDWKLETKEAGLRAERWKLCSTSQHSSTWWSLRLKAREERGEGGVGGLRAERWKLYSTSQHSSTWWSNWKLVKKEAGLRYQR